MAGYGSLRCTICREHPKKNKRRTQLMQINGLFYCQSCGDRHNNLLKAKPGIIHKSHMPQGIVVVNPRRST